MNHKNSEKKSDWMYSVTWANWFKDWLKSRLYAVQPKWKENKQATKCSIYTPIHLHRSKKQEWKTQQPHSQLTRTRTHTIYFFYMQSTEQRTNSAQTNTHTLPNGMMWVCQRSRTDGVRIQWKRATVVQIFHMIFFSQRKICSMLICFLP